MSLPLIAVAHGSRDPRAAATVRELLEEVRHARPGLPVRPAYLDHAAPTLPRALSGLPSAAVLPLLLTDAYHSRVDIPGVLREVRGTRVRYGATLGPHPLLTRALERRLAEAGVPADDPGAARDTAVVLVSAGSSDPRANRTVARLARRWAHERGWWAATAAYASASGPRPGEEVARLLRAGAPRVVVAPYLLAPGFFADRVRDAALEAGAATVADVLGAAPEVAAVVLERYDEAVASAWLSKPA
jgi:sirohydrochlorin ferrochelatase